MSVGGTLINPSGQRLVNSVGQRVLSNGGADSCCCGGGSLFQMRKCCNNALTNVWVPASMLPLGVGAAIKYKTLCYTRGLGDPTSSDPTGKDVPASVQQKSAGCADTSCTGGGYLVEIVGVSPHNVACCPNSIQAFGRSGAPGGATAALNPGQAKQVGTVTYTFFNAPNVCTTQTGTATNRVVLGLGSNAVAINDEQGFTYFSAHFASLPDCATPQITVPNEFTDTNCGIGGNGGSATISFGQPDVLP